jgi:ABC-type Mn2+/Zn2+ transport system ATPase subunit
VNARLAVEQLAVDLGGRRILEDITFTLEAGSMTALLGASGAGKSTLLGALDGRLRPACGRVEVIGGAHTGAGFVPQLPLDDHSPFSITEIVTLARPRHGMGTRRTERDRAGAILERLGLSGLLERRLAELSGGQRQRVAIAAATYLGSPVLLCDEPTSGADPALADDVLGLLRELADQGGIVVVSSHDEVRLRGVVDRVLGLRDGRLILDKGVVAVTGEDVERVYRDRTGES